MKRILIVNNNLHIGGVQKALVNLLWAIRREYDVTLLLFNKGGAYLEELPPEVKVITPGSHYRFLGMTGKDVRTLPDKLGRAFFAGITRVFGRKFAVALMALGQKRLKGFDVAVSYLHNGGYKVFYGGCNDFVLRHVSAARKITFLHCDYRLCGADTSDNGKQYALFDAIAACSQGCADSFLFANPSLADRVRVVYNCHRNDALHNSAREAAVQLPKGRTNIVTVARLGAEKGVPRAIEALGSLPKDDSFHYYVIGDGVQRPVVESMIVRLDLRERVTLLGEMANPYGYIQAADLLLIPSVSEAAPMVIGEAARLGTPVLSTRTSSAEEMIAETGLGWVCDNSVAGMEEGLSLLLKDIRLLEEKKKNLPDVVLDNQDAVSAFNKIIDG